MCRSGREGGHPVSGEHVVRATDILSSCCLCWWYRKYAPRNTELARFEKHARETKQGLWGNPAQVPPWEWRKRTR
jgi:hypothetical protein